MIVICPLCGHKVRLDIPRSGGPDRRFPIMRRHYSGSSKEKNRKKCRASGMVPENARRFFQCGVGQ